jgi:hypothetical protein
MILILSTVFAFQVAAVHAEILSDTDSLNVVEKEAVALAEEASMNMNKASLIGREDNSVINVNTGDDLPSNEIREAFESIMGNGSGESVEGDRNE